LSGSIHSSSRAKGVERKDEQRGDDEVERGVQVSGLPGGIGIERRQRVADRGQERQEHRTADDARDQVAERQAPAGGIAAAHAFEDGVDRAAEIGAQHQRERRNRRHDARLRQRHG
jgi:hypothetical protein